MNTFDRPRDRIRERLVITCLLLLLVVVFTAFVVYPWTIAVCAAGTVLVAAFLKGCPLN